MKISTQVGLIGVAGMLAAFASPAGAGSQIVAICHVTGGRPVLIEIPENAVQAHLDHGDYFLPEFEKIPRCF